MAPLVVLLCLLLTGPFSLAQDSPDFCLEGQRHVPFERCLDGLSEEAELDVRIGLDDYVCCSEDKVIGGDAKSDLCEHKPGFQCVSVDYCLTVRSDSTDSAEVDLSVRQLDIQSAATNKCRKDSEVCCRQNDIVLPPSSSTKAQPSEPPASLATPFTTPSTVVKSEDKSYTPKCGRHNDEGVGVRILDATGESSSTSFGEWPYMCVIYEIVTDRSKQGVDQFLGGASLIAPGIVLTAAHKVVEKSASSLKVRCGDWDLNHEGEPFAHQDRLVSRIIAHPAFHKKLIWNNFALLHLTEEFELTENIDTICLPAHPGPEASSEYLHKDCYATGWGKDSFGATGKYQNIMRKAMLNLVPLSDCESRLRTAPTIPDDFKLDTSFVCAGGEDEDTCEGDGGGPLMCPSSTDSPDNTETFIQVGIVSWGVKCGTPGVPGVYASVQMGLCFIDWATKCQHGDTYNDFYHFEQCHGWIDAEIQRLRSEVQTVDTKLKVARLPEKERRKTMKQLEELQESLRKAEQLATSCVMNISSLGERHSHDSDPTLDVRSGS